MARHAPTAAEVVHSAITAEADAQQAAIAVEREVLKQAIAKLVNAHVKPVKRAFEVKLTINHAVMETAAGEQAALEVAIQVAQKIVEKWRAIQPKGAAQ